MPNPDQDAGIGENGAAKQVGADYREPDQHRGEEPHVNAK